VCVHHERDLGDGMGASLTYRSFPFLLSLLKAKLGAAECERGSISTKLGDLQDEMTRERASTTATIRDLNAKLSGG